MVTDTETADDTDDAPTPDDSIDPDEGADEGAEEGGSEGGSDDVPDLDADEKADVPQDLAAKMAETRDDQEDEDGDPPDEGGEAGDGDEDDTAPETPPEGGSEGVPEGGNDPGSEDTWGDVYVDGLGIFLLEISAELNETGETDMSEEDIRNLATSGPIDLPYQFNQLIDEMGMDDEMTPAQATVAGSAFIAFAVLMKETDAAGDLVGMVSAELDLEGGAA